MLTSACQPAAAPSDPRSPPSSAFVVGVRPQRASLFLDGAEPSLDEVMDDPMVRRLMDRDGVEVDHLLSLIEEVRGKLR